MVRYFAIYSLNSTYIYHILVYKTSINNQTRTEHNEIHLAFLETFLLTNEEWNSFTLYIYWQDYLLFMMVILVVLYILYTYIYIGIMADVYHMIYGRFITVFKQFITLKNILNARLTNLFSLFYAQYIASQYRNTEWLCNEGNEIRVFPHKKSEIIAKSSHCRIFRSLNWNLY